MRIRKVVSKRLRRSSGGRRVVGDTNIVLAVNAQEPGTARSQGEQRVRVVQRDTGPPPASSDGDDPTEGDTNG
jgi:hypothetical protein